MVIQLPDERSSGQPADTRDAPVAENGSASEHESLSALPQVPPTSAEGQEDDGPEEDPMFGGNHVNTSGGYSFSHPTSWTVRETGTLTELFSAGEQIAISFGIGSSGGIEPAYEDFVSLIDSTYEGASVEVVRADRVKGSLRLKLTGAATTKAGFQIWYTARVIALGDGESLATLAAGPLETRDAGKALANEILDSFEPSAELGAWAASHRS